MTTQVSFTTDKSLKDMALQKARAEGISLKTLLVYALKGFVEGSISLSIHSSNHEPDVEELFITDPSLQKKAEKLATLLDNAPPLPIHRQT